MRLCKDFVRAMGRVEAALATMGSALSKEEQTEVLEEILGWLGTDEVSGTFTKEIARELIAQMSARAMYADYGGSPDTYIQ